MLGRFHEHGPGGKRDANFATLPCIVYRWNGIFKAVSRHHHTTSPVARSAFILSGTGAALKHNLPLAGAACTQIHSRTVPLSVLPAILSFQIDASLQAGSDHRFG